MTGWNDTRTASSYPHHDTCKVGHCRWVGCLVVIQLQQSTGHFVGRRGGRRRTVLAEVVVAGCICHEQPYVVRTTRTILLATVCRQSAL